MVSGTDKGNRKVSGMDMDKVWRMMEYHTALRMVLHTTQGLGMVSGMDKGSRKVSGMDMDMGLHKVCRKVSEMGNCME